MAVQIKSEHAQRRSNFPYWTITEDIVEVVAFVRLNEYIGFIHIEMEGGGHTRRQQREKSHRAKRRIYM